MSEPVDRKEGPSAADYLKLIEYQVRQAEKELKEGERLSVMVHASDEVVVVAAQLECHEPNVLIAREVRQGRRRTLIAPIGSLHITIETEPTPVEAEGRPRHLGFRVPD